MPDHEKTFRLTVITPEAPILDTRVQSASFTAHDGEIGIRPQRAPLICKLGIGTLCYTTDAGPFQLFIDGGFAEVLNNEVAILTQRTLKPESIDRQSAEQDLTAARVMKIADDASFAARQAALQRARAKLRLAP